ncbi:MAG: hypothetical protein WCA20_13730, partial [Candidatus Sulfotelmatobacter sp.]
DAELFISYNMPAKALGPLMAALPQAPNDLRLNQRLAALHTRAARFAEASVCCRTLQNVYSEAGYPEEATRYGELAVRYEERSAAPAVTDSIMEQAASLSIPEEISGASASTLWPTDSPEPAEETEFALVNDPDDSQDHVQHDRQASPVAESPAAPAEIDLSSQWDDSITIEDETPSAEAAEIEVTEAVGDHAIPTDKPQQGGRGKARLDREKTNEAVEEIRFYLEHGMPEQASAAFEKLQALCSDLDTLKAVRADIEAASQHTPAAEEVTTVEAVSEFATDEPHTEFTIDEIPAAARESAAVVEQSSPEPEAQVAETHAPSARHDERAGTEPRVIEPPIAPAPGVLQEFVSELESSLGENFGPGTISHQAEPAREHASGQAPAPQHVVQPDDAEPELERVGNAPPPAFGVPQAEPMGEFVADLEASLGNDFLKQAPLAEPGPASQTETPVASVPEQHWPVPAPAPPVSTRVAAAAAATSSGTPTLSPQATVLAPHRPAPAAPVPHISPVIPSANAAATKASPFGEDAGVDLAEMFGELKHDLEAGSSTTEEDPETHYNLGIAFREMGLLDEAIGELQKTCQAVDRGHPFPQVMQTYTWLAQCFLDKGLPEAAIRWYDKALNVPGIDEETRTALHYELAAAYETAGDKSSALKHFMEVYGRNIDYRDVAERIKPLKS